MNDSLTWTATSTSSLSSAVLQSAFYPSPHDSFTVLNMQPLQPNSYVAIHINGNISNMKQTDQSRELALQRSSRVLETSTKQWCCPGSAARGQLLEWILLPL